jgi:coatomer subunit beta'
VSGADDKLIKVWDYQTKACVQTLEGHAHNISCVAFHPELPIILSGSEDGMVKMWHSTTYRWVRLGVSWVCQGRGGGECRVTGCGCQGEGVWVCQGRGGGECRV